MPIEQDQPRCECSVPTLPPHFINTTIRYLDLGAAVLSIQYFYRTDAGIHDINTAVQGLADKHKWSGQGQGVDAACTTVERNYRQFNHLVLIVSCVTS